MAMAMMRTSFTALLLVAVHAAASPPRCRAASGLSIAIGPATTQHSGTRTVDAIVSNRGEKPNADNFDADLEVRLSGRLVCRASTNFVTPVDGGQSVPALRFEVRPSDSSAVEMYMVRAAIRYWSSAQKRVQIKTNVVLPPGAGSCIALKPVQ